MNEKDIDRIADKIIERMKTDKEIKTEKQLTPFQKTEKLLSELSLLKGAIDSKNMLIEDLKKEGISIQKKETGVNVQASKVYLSELEKVENKIEKLEEEIARIGNVVNMVERALDTIKNDKYYKIIEMKYFDELTFEHISEKLNISVITAKRYKNKMIRQLQLVIFSDDVIKNILN
nr:MAG TPA: RNA polymerase sigma factor [Caudoviricetes sp.]